MKILKIILIFPIVLLVLVLVIALIVPSKYVAKREVLINKPLVEVFNYLKYLKNQDDFSAWAKMDSSMKKAYKGTDGTVGFIGSWDSQNPNVGAGEQELKQIVEGKRIDSELRFVRPLKTKAQMYMTTERINANKTKVLWSFEGKIDYPMNIVLLIFDAPKAIGNDFEIGLRHLKQLLERKGDVQG